MITALLFDQIFALFFIPIITIICRFEIRCICRRIRHRHTCTARLILPIRIVFGSIPGRSIFKDYTRKAATAIERPIAYACYTIGNRYARKTATAIERPIAYACYTVGNCYARKAATVIERPRAYACYTVRNRYARKAATAMERIRADSCAACYDYCFKR